MSLEADDVVQGRTAVILAQLDDGVGQFSRIGKFKTDGFHGTETHGVDAAAGHDFDGHAAFKDAVVLFKVVEFGTFGRRQSLPEGFIFFLRKGAVQVIGAALTVTSCPIDLVHIERFDGDNGRCGVVEMEVPFPGQLGDGVGQGVAGQGTAGDNADLVRRELGHFFVANGNQGMSGQFFRHILTKGQAVDGQGPAGGNAVDIGRFHDQRAQAAHFFLQQADGVFDIGGP